MRNATKALLERSEKLKYFNKCYDEGKECFAIDIATIIRTICKDSKNTQSLLTQTELKSQITFCLYSNIRIDERNLYPSNPLCTMNISVGQGSSRSIYAPKLDDVKEIEGNIYYADFNQWWDQVVIKDSLKNKFTRKELVETVCDKEGGAHYDRTLDEKYENLFYQNSIGWLAASSNQKGRPFDNKVHLASIRHISYELVNALDDLQLKKGI